MQAANPSRTNLGDTSRYVLSERIGRGGQGDVYRANDTQLNRWVAIKCLVPNSEEAARRMEVALREVGNLASLQHPNIVTLFDFVQQGNEVLVVMEYLQGRTLQDIAEERTLSVPEFQEVARQTLDGLIAAHSVGMLHRDLKPTNLMLVPLPSGKFQVKILDFGLAKVVAGDSLQTIEHSNSVFGSIFTMAPEQLEHEAIDVRTDLYSLGCSFYFALTSEYPFVGDGVPSIISAHLSHRVVPLNIKRPDLPRKLCDWVMRLIARDPRNRFMSAVDATNALNTLRLDKPDAKTDAIRIITTAIQLIPRAVKAPDPAGIRRLQVLASVLALAVAVFVAVLIVLRGSLPSAVFGAKPPEFPADQPPATTTTIPAISGGVAATTAAAGAVIPDSPAVPLQPRRPFDGKVLSVYDRAELMDREGAEVVVEGSVAKADTNAAGTLHYIRFQNALDNDLSLVLIPGRGNRDDFSRKLAQFVGKPIEVRGTVSVTDGRPVIMVWDLSQITTGL